APRHARDWLDAASQATTTLAAGARLVALQAALDRVLPDALRGRVRVASFEAGVLGVLVPGGAAGGRLRQDAASVRTALARTHPDVRQIDITVSAGMTRVAPPKVKRAVLGAEAAAPLTALAQALPDSPLRDSVLRLARKARFRQ
nr:DUF721 domain-containing protein [Burkholderiales bacterium]